MHAWTGRAAAVAAGMAALAVVRWISSSEPERASAVTDVGAAYTLTPDTLLDLGTAGDLLSGAVALSAAGDVVLLAGADDVHVPNGEDPIPLRLGDTARAFVWDSRHVAHTHPYAVGVHDSRVAAEPRSMTYLAAHVLVPGDSLSHADGPSPEWAIVTIEPGEGCRVRFDAPDAMLFDLRERDTGVFFLAARETAGTVLSVPAGTRAVWVIRRSPGTPFRLHVTPAPGVRPLPPWRRIVSDDGEWDSYWGQVAGTFAGLAKTLDLEVAPASLTAARIVFHTGHEPWHLERKAFAGAAGARGATWSALKLHVNGELVYTAPLDEGARLGWHYVPVPTAVLRRGANEVRFTNTGNDGYYVSIDLDTSEGKSAAVEGGTRNARTLRPYKAVGPGEYMVRLEVR